VVTLAILLLAFAEFGLLIGISFVVLFLAVSAVAGAVFIPAPESRHYLGIILHSLINRHADYTRDGDKLRGEAASLLLSRFLDAYSDVVGLDAPRGE
jgi:hypothetical protein